MPLSHASSCASCSAHTCRRSAVSPASFISSMKFSTAFSVQRSVPAAFCASELIRSQKFISNLPLPLRISNFSTRITFASGFASLAVIAAANPEGPPPTTTISAFTSSIVLASLAGPAVVMVIASTSMPACFIASATALFTAKDENVAALTLSTTGELASKIRSLIIGNARSITTFVSWFSPNAISVITLLSMVTVRFSSPPQPEAFASNVPAAVSGSLLSTGALLLEQAPRLTAIKPARLAFTNLLFIFPSKKKVPDLLVNILSSLKHYVKL